jgi:nitroreductase
MTAESPCRSGTEAPGAVDMSGSPRVHLTPDELLSTTRAVRRRLDLTRGVERGLLEECLTLAQQAPTGSLAQDWHFVIVRDADKRSALGELWRAGAAGYLRRTDTHDDRARTRLVASVRHLHDHIHEVPVHVIPCLAGRIDGAAAPVQAGRWASIMPAVWSFMLAARSRGLGTVWTSFHLQHEREAAEILGIPFAEVMQAALIPVAHTVGTGFQPSPRKPLRSFVHWDSWQLAEGDDR